MLHNVYCLSQAIHSLAEGWVYGCFSAVIMCCVTSCTSLMLSCGCAFTFKMLGFIRLVPHCVCVCVCLFAGQSVV